MTQEEKYNPMTIAEQVNILFDMLKRADGKPYTFPDVSEKASINLATLSKLKSGNLTNPTLITLRRLAKFFDIQLDYFDCRSADECRTYLAQRRVKPQGKIDLTLVLKSHGLSEKGVSHVLDTISYIQSSELSSKASS